MSSYHPTDNELQQYALEGMGLGEDVSTHIQGCAACSAKLANYRLLTRQISALQKPAFDFNLADLVLQQLPAPKAEFPWIAALGVTLTMIFLIAVALLFGTYLLQLFQNLPALFGTILTASAIAIFAGMLNTMIKEHHDQMKKLDFN
ncbi:hypothetical protein [Mucilaginibacter ginsenosidivorax]|uniref:Zinc-finger domain-containing protein n=1 Tax=Mucilaginibacter ginsenosidivorax TaxID=862126 RepID=A0A5B8WAJ0_9SPHI|nr:hypothetical protein [Mucilaginibacter ginsenosidivorax]QEC79228.1 hypothetical protein FSB76_25970 [Mucilaginibacter ginsenosidivorax]